MHVYLALQIELPVADGDEAEAMDTEDGAQDAGPDARIQVRSGLQVWSDLINK